MSNLNDMNDSNFTNNLCDALLVQRNALFNELKSDKEGEKEAVINKKIYCIDNIIKNIYKYKNICLKEKNKGNL